MKKFLFTLLPLLLASCSDGADGRFEHIQTVRNESSVAVSFRNDVDGRTLSVNAGETKDIGFFCGNSLPVLTLDDAAFPRVSVSSEYRSPKVFEKVYTVSDMQPKNVQFTNASAFDVVLSGKYLGDTYSEGGFPITSGGSVSLKAYSPESYTAKYSTGDSATVSLQGGKYVIR